MVIVTSYFYKVKELQDAGFDVYSVSSSYPEGIDVPVAVELVLSQFCLVLRSRSDYKKMAREYSLQLKTRDLLGRFLERNGFDDAAKIALVSWKKEDEHCHRHLIRKYIEKNHKSIETYEF